MRFVEKYFRHCFETSDIVGRDDGLPTYDVKETMLTACCTNGTCDARHFVRALRGETRLRVSAMIDIDPLKCGNVYVTPVGGPRSKVVARIPIVHFESAEVRASSEPVVCCVSLRRAHDQAGARTSVRRNVGTLGLEEGKTLWYFC